MFFLGGNTGRVLITGAEQQLSVIIVLNDSDVIALKAYFEKVGLFGRVTGIFFSKSEIEDVVFKVIAIRFRELCSLRKGNFRLIWVRSG